MKKTAININTIISKAFNDYGMFLENNEIMNLVVSEFVLLGFDPDKAQEIVDINENYKLI